MSETKGIGNDVPQMMSEESFNQVTSGVNTDFKREPLKKGDQLEFIFTADSVSRETTVNGIDWIKISFRNGRSLGLNALLREGNGIEKASNAYQTLRSLSGHVLKIDSITWQESRYGRCPAYHFTTVK